MYTYRRPAERWQNFPTPGETLGETQGELTEETPARRAPEIDVSVPGWTFRMIGDPEFGRDPRPFFRILRDRPAQRDDLEMAGRASTIVVARAGAVDRVLRNPQIFSSDFGSGLGGLGNDRPLIPLQIDPPEHKKYRVLLDPYFAPRQMGRLEREVAALVNQLIDGFIGRGECDFTAEFAVPLPSTVFLRLLGLPAEDLGLLLEIKEGIVRSNGETTFQSRAAARAAAAKRCYEYFEASLRRLGQEGSQGLLRLLLDARVDGVRLSREELMDVCFLLVLAGLDTVTDSLCCFWAHLAAHPERRQRIVSDPAAIPSAVEELLRWESPVSLVARRVTEDADLDGCPVRKGESVLVFVGAANMDAATVERPDEVDFDRPLNRHCAFGGGIHRCLGSHLARLELRVALHEWHRRLPHYHVAPGVELAWTPMLRSVPHMPLVLAESGRPTTQAKSGR
jgi:cytochrome P450